MIKVVGASNVDILSNVNFITFSDGIDTKNYDWNLLAQFCALTYALRSCNDVDVYPPFRLSVLRFDG